MRIPDPAIVPLMSDVRDGGGPWRQLESGRRLVPIFLSSAFHRDLIVQLAGTGGTSSVINRLTSQVGEPEPGGRMLEGEGTPRTSGSSVSPMARP